MYYFFYSSLLIYCTNVAKAKMDGMKNIEIDRLKGKDSVYHISNGSNW